MAFARLCEQRRERIRVRFKTSCSMTRVQRITEAAIYQLETKLASTKATRESYRPRARIPVKPTRRQSHSPHMFSTAHYPNHDPTATRSVHALHCARCETRVGNSQFAPRDEPLHADLFIRDAVKRAPLQRCRTSPGTILSPLITPNCELFAWDLAVSHRRN